MPLGKHTKTETGRIRQERSDSLVRNLEKDYPILGQFDPRTKLGTLKEKYEVESLDKLLKMLKE